MALSTPFGAPLSWACFFSAFLSAGNVIPFMALVMSVTDGACDMDRSSSVAKGPAKAAGTFSNAPGPTLFLLGLGADGSPENGYTAGAGPGAGA